MPLNTLTHDNLALKDASYIKASISLSNTGDQKGMHIFQSNTEIQHEVQTLIYTYKPDRTCLILANAKSD